MNAATTTRHRLLMTDVNLLRQGWSAPVVDAHCSYVRPVTLDDEFNLVSRVIDVGRSSFVVGHDFIDATGLFARGECRHVWIRTHPKHAAMRVPEWLRQALVPRESAPTSNGKAKSTGESSPGMPQLSLSPNVTQASTSHD